MLCHRALGDERAERREEALYTRFKADEAAQTITGSYRRRNPEANLERQPIHEHANRYSAPAAASARGAARAPARAFAPEARAGERGAGQ